VNQRLLASVMLVAGTAVAQPVVTQPADSNAPLAEIRDEKQLANELALITQDPSIPVTDPKTRTLAQALLSEGVKQIQDRKFEQALANFLEAYAKFPSARILLNVAGTLHDMGREADAANTYEKYAHDSGASPERLPEVQKILASIDATLTTLVIHVQPRGVELSIDGGPFVSTGLILTTRVRPGTHLVRARKGETSIEIGLNGFEAEVKDITASLPIPTETLPPAPNAPPPEEPAEEVRPWLTNGTLYGTGDASSNERKTRATYGGDEVAAIIPDYELTEDGQVRVKAPEDDSIDSGVVAAMRIDGKLRGFAGAIGIALSRGHLELDALYLRSELNGAYLGGRYRLYNGFVRPYVQAGVPVFLFTNPTDKSTDVAFGLRAAGGVELPINGHFSVQGDIGYEHFFVDENETHFEANEVVYTLGMIGRL
jgi:hypothetical protein